MTKPASLKPRPSMSARRITRFRSLGARSPTASADAIWHAETQMFNGHGVAKYLLSRAVRAAGIKVVFTGEGADEMLEAIRTAGVDALNDNAALSAGERVALLDDARRECGDPRVVDAGAGRQPGDAGNASAGSDGCSATLNFAAAQRRTA